MNFVENNGKKVAAILCVASAFPVVATIYAQETATGWHGDTYVNQDKKVAKGWTQIDGKSYYFDQKGKLDSEKSYNASAAVASTSVKEDVKASVSRKAQASVAEEQAVETASADNSEVQAVSEVSADTDAQITTAQADTATTETPVEAAAPAEETVNVQEVSQPADQADQDIATPVADTNESDAAQTAQQPADDADVADAPAADQAQPAQEQAQPQQQAEQKQEQPAQAQAPQQQTNSNQQNNSQETKAPASNPTNTGVSDATSQYADLNARIAAAALAEVGTTDGQQCTEVATGALNAAGVNASVVWPSEYVQYGHYVSADQAVAGNLIYYANGGAGAAHIAVYVGNGQAVQGNFDGKTVVAAADLSSYGTGASAAQYIQITG